MDVTAQKSKIRHDPKRRQKSKESKICLSKTQEFEEVNNSSRRLHKRSSQYVWPEEGEAQGNDDSTL